MFVVRLGGGIDLPSSWLTRFFSGCPALYRFSSALPHTRTNTHTLIPKALPPFLFFFPFPFFSPTLSQINLCLPIVLLIPPPKTHSQSHTHTYSSSSHCNCNQIKYMILHPLPPPFPAFPLFPLHMRTMPFPALPNAYFCV